VDHALHRDPFGWRGLGVLEALRPLGVVLVATDRDRRLDLGLFAGTDVGFAEVAGVGQQRLRPGKVFGPEPRDAPASG